MGTLKQRDDETETKETTKKLFNAALASLKGDPGLHQLVPYFTRFISQEISKNLYNLDLLYTLLRMVEVLLLNANLKMDPYLHQLMPSIFTCLVGKKLTENPHADHWSLRDYAARLIALVCNKYGKAYKDLQPRTTKTLVQTFLDPLKPLTSHYGAIIGLSALGPHCVQLLLIPNISAYVKLLEPLLNQNEDLIRKMEAMKCYDAVLNIAGNFLKYAAEYYDKLGSTSSIIGETPHTKRNKSDKSSNPDIENMQIDSILITESSGFEKKKKSKEIQPIPRSHLVQIIAMQELDNINERYQEFYGLFGEALLPFVRESTLFTAL
jgi:transcription initiation factor TFIID subunit 6